MHILPFMALLALPCTTQYPTFSTIRFRQKPEKVFETTTRPVASSSPNLANSPVFELTRILDKEERILNARKKEGRNRRFPEYSGDPKVQKRATEKAPKKQAQEMFSDDQNNDSAYTLAAGATLLIALLLVIAVVGGVVGAMDRKTETPQRDSAPTINKSYKLQTTKDGMKRPNYQELTTAETKLSPTPVPDQRKKPERNTSEPSVSAYTVSTLSKVTEIPQDPTVIMKFNGVKPNAMRPDQQKETEEQFDARHAPSPSQVSGEDKTMYKVSEIPQDPDTVIITFDDKVDSIGRALQKKGDPQRNARHSPIVIGHSSKTMFKVSEIPRDPDAVVITIDAAKPRIPEGDKEKVVRASKTKKGRKRERKPDKEKPVEWLKTPDLGQTEKAKSPQSTPEKMKRKRENLAQPKVTIPDQKQQVEVPLWRAKKFKENHEDMNMEATTVLLPTRIGEEPRKISDRIRQRQQMLVEQLNRIPNQDAKKIGIPIIPIGVKKRQESAVQKVSTVAGHAKKGQFIVTDEPRPREQVDAKLKTKVPNKVPVLIFQEPRQKRDDAERKTTVPLISQAPRPKQPLDAMKQTKVQYKKDERAPVLIPKEPRPKQHAPTTRKSTIPLISQAPWPKQQQHDAKQQAKAKDKKDKRRPVSIPQEPMPKKQDDPKTQAKIQYGKEERGLAILQEPRQNEDKVTEPKPATALRTSLTSKEARPKQGEPTELKVVRTPEPRQEATKKQPDLPELKTTALPDEKKRSLHNLQESLKGKITAVPKTPKVSDEEEKSQPVTVGGEPRTKQRKPTEPKTTSLLGPWDSKEQRLPAVRTGPIIAYEKVTDPSLSPAKVPPDREPAPLVQQENLAPEQKTLPRQPIAPPKDKVIQTLSKDLPVAKVPSGSTYEEVLPLVGKEERACYLS